MPVSELRLIMRRVGATDPCANPSKEEARKYWSGREDLNLRPPGPEPGALPG
jgi:hypothetical protein